MSFMERALAFECAGEELVGIIAEPASPSSVAVLIVVGGPQYRAGSHRQFVQIARRLAAQGITVMRFDYRGMGDSSGDPRAFDECSADIGAAVDVLLATNSRVTRVVLWGLCDAASASLIYWQETRDPRVAGMVLLNPWVRSDASLAKTHIKHYYGQRLMEREFWAKLFGGQVDAVGAVRGLAASLTRATGLARQRHTGNSLSYQDRMAQAIRAFNGPILLILSGRDLTAKEFLEYSSSNPAWDRVLERPDVARCNLADADHTFSSKASSVEVESRTLHWLLETVLVSQ